MMQKIASVWILGDQLSDPHPALLEAEQQYNRQGIRVLMILSQEHMQRRKYHKKKIVLLISAMRHYAEELREAGYQVDYHEAQDFSSAITQHLQLWQPEKLFMMGASSFCGQTFQKFLNKNFDVQTDIVTNDQFLTNRFGPLPEVQPGETVRQERFYREMREHFHLLMDGRGEPEGGQWNYDSRNRQQLPDDLDIPEPLRFKPDSLTRSIMYEVGSGFDGTGDVDGFELAVTRAQALQAAEDFFNNRLQHFGTYEDAMSQDQSLLFHSKLSPYVNLGLLDPLELAQCAERAYRQGRAELNNVEGFIRQVVGWREYMFWQYQRLMPGLASKNFWGATRSVPDFFWNGRTNMNCLKHIIGRALEDGYVHHIERLMLLSNFCLLTEIQPQAVVDWFMCCFIDAYEWVMIPNVIGMGLYADGGQIGTKPYLASANYIHKMSDYCSNCPFDYRKRTGEGACPFNFLYWYFLIKHESKLRENHRMSRMLYHLKRFNKSERVEINEEAKRFIGSDFQ